MINIEILDKDVVELEVPGKVALIKRAEWGHIVGDISNQEDLQAELDLKAKEIDLENHMNNKENPHEVTKVQVGLGNVDNTSDIDKPISTAVQDALELKANVSRVEVVENDINSLGSNINTLNDSVTELQSSVGSLENEIITLYDKKEDITNKVTTLSAQSTDIQYPSAKAVYDNAITPINNINSKIPSQATSENPLADKNFVNSSIATNTAYFKGTYDIVNDLGLTVSATHEQVAAALSTAITSVTNNDYCFVSIPSTTHVGDVDEYDRYKYDGTSWVFEYSLNNSSFTSNQWEAINSGITSALVGQITTNANNIALKENTSNKVTSISSQSSNVDYPSAKAVYTELSKKVGNNPGVSHANRILTIGGEGSTARKGKARWSKIETGQGIDLDIVQDTSSTPSSYTFKLNDNIINELNGKANDNEVVHKTGQETIKGNKRFDDNIYFPTSSYTGYYKINKDGIVYTKSNVAKKIDFPVPTRDDKLALLSDITSFDTLNTVLSTDATAQGTYPRLMKYNSSKKYLWLDDRYRIIDENGLSSSSYYYSHKFDKSGQFECESDATHTITDMSNAFGILSPNDDGRVIVFFRCHGTCTIGNFTNVPYYSIRAKVSNTDGTFDDYAGPSTVLWSNESDISNYTESGTNLIVNYSTQNGTISIWEPWGEDGCDYCFFSKIRFNDNRNAYQIITNGTANTPTASETCQDISRIKFTVSDGTITRAGNVETIISGSVQVNMDGNVNNHSRVGMCSFSKIKGSTKYIGVVEDSVNQTAATPRNLNIQLVEITNINSASIDPDTDVTTPRSILLPNQNESRGAPFVTTLKDGRIVISFMSSQEYTGYKNSSSTYNRVIDVYVSKVPITEGMIETITDNMFSKVDFFNFGDSQWGRWGTTQFIDGVLYKTFTFGYNDSSGSAHRIGNLVIYGGDLKEIQDIDAIINRAINASIANSY